MLQKMYFDKDGNLAGRTGPLGRGKTVYFMGREVDIPETLVYIWEEEDGGCYPQFINLAEEEIEERLTALVKTGHKFEFSSLLLPNGRNFAPFLYPDNSEDGFFPVEWLARHARLYERMESRRHGEWGQELESLEYAYKLLDLPEVENMTPVEPVDPLGNKTSNPDHQRLVA